MAAGGFSGGGGGGFIGGGFRVFVVVWKKVLIALRSDAAMGWMPRKDAKVSSSEKRVSLSLLQLWLKKVNNTHLICQNAPPFGVAR